MKIGIDAHVLGKNLGGVERFIAELISALPDKTPEHEYLVFVTKEAYDQLALQTNAQVQYIPLAFSNPLMERLVLLPWLVHKYKLDALMIQRLAPWFCGKCRLIVTIHDLTPIKFAADYKGLSNALVRMLTKNSIKRADLILTPTKAIKEEIIDYCSSVKAPIHHFYNGVDTSAFNQANKQTNATKYLLTVGAIERRKNIETIIRALPLMSDQSIQLKIMGGIRDQAYFEELMSLVKSLMLQTRVEYLGFVSEQALIATYQNAAMFITASKDEGFNIPPLESMACGVPVACSSIPVHLELFEGAAMFFKATSVQDLAKKVSATLDDDSISQILSNNGYDKVTQYTWDQTANNVATALRAV